MLSVFDQPTKTKMIELLFGEKEPTTFQDPFIVIASQLPDYDLGTVRSVIREVVIDLMNDDRVDHETIIAMNPGTFKTQFFREAMHQAHLNGKLPNTYRDFYGVRPNVRSVDFRL